MGNKKWGIVLRLKKALTKFSVLLRLHCARRLPSRRLRSAGFSYRPVRPRPVPPQQPPPPPPPRCGIVKDDVDERAQNFIDDFCSRLWLERQISTQLRYYYRSSSCGTEYEDGSPPPPPPPPPRSSIM